MIDYTKTDFSTAIKDVDLVFDLIGGDVRFKSFPVQSDEHLLNVGIEFAPSNG